MALVEQRCPREVPEHVLPFGPVQYSRAFGSCTGNAMAGQYSWNANAHSFHLQNGMDSYFCSMDSKLSAYEGSTMLELAIWKSKIVEQTDGVIYPLNADLKMACRIDSLTMVGIVIPNVLSFLRGDSNEGDDDGNDDKDNDDDGDDDEDDVDNDDNDDEDDADDDGDNDGSDEDDGDGEDEY